MAKTTYTVLLNKSVNYPYEAAGQPNATLVQYVQAANYAPLTASDGTGNCYSFRVWVFNVGTCQTTYHGGAPGEGAALYCTGSTGWRATPQPNGQTPDELDCIATLQT